MQSDQIIKKEIVLQQIRTILPQLTQAGVKKIGLFGSVRREEATIDSDIDILIEFVKGKKSYSNLLKIKGLLESTLHKKVDLVQLDWLSKYIGPKILEEVEYIEGYS